MRDPVADVLAERPSGSGGVAAAVAVSLFLHAGGGALAVYSALRQPPPQAVSKLNITFAQTPAVAPLAPLSPATPPEPAAPRIEEPRAVPVVPPPEKPPEPAPKNTAPLSPFGRSTKKGVDAVVPPPPAPPRSVQATSTAGSPGAGIGGPVGVGEAGVTALEGGDFPYTLYLDQMKRLIGARWFRPQAGGDSGTIVYFRIERDGTIRDARTTTPSGNNTFDRAALRAVLETSPLPPLPFGYSGNYLGVHLTFR